MPSSTALRQLRRLTGYLRHGNTCQALPPHPPGRQHCFWLTTSTLGRPTLGPLMREPWTCGQDYGSMSSEPSGRFGACGRRPSCGTSLLPGGLSPLLWTPSSRQFSGTFSGRKATFETWTTMAEASAHLGGEDETRRWVWVPSIRFGPALPSFAASTDQQTTGDLSFTSARTSPSPSQHDSLLPRNCFAI